MSLRPTAYFTVGPFFPPHFVEPAACDLTRAGGQAAKGERILLTGRVLEQGGAVTRNTIVEIWQPDAEGLFPHPADPRSAAADPNFLGWGRAATDGQGWYRFRTIMPGRRVDNEGPPRLPHINMMFLASGLMRRLVTTVFFDADPVRAEDPVLAAVPVEALRRRLIAERAPDLDQDGFKAWRFDVRFRGENEPPFFQD